MCDSDNGSSSRHIKEAPPCACDISALDTVALLDQKPTLAPRSGFAISF